MTWFLAALALTTSLLFLRERLRRLSLRHDLEQLRAKREAMRSVLEHLDEGVFLLGRDLSVYYANPAALHLVAADASAMSSRPNLARVLRNRQILAFAAAIGSGETVRQVVTTPAADGSPMELEVTLAPAGHNRRLMVLRDLRDSARVERKRRDFVANASHELKTPIAALVGLLDLLDVVPAEKHPDLLERARRNANALASMADDLLGLTRAEDPDWRPSPTLTAVGPLIDQILGPILDAAAAKGLQTKVEISLRDPELLVDPVCFETVLRNLAQNAVNYTSAGDVEVRMRDVDESCVALEVSDSGPGIDPKILPRIFERFFRGDPSHSRATGGTGLGLSIVRNLVNRMGGRISVHSNPGRGSEFKVELPRNPARPLGGS